MIARPHMAPLPNGQACNFPDNTGIRERLALLASQGPADVADWTYDQQFDRWFRFRRGGASAFSAFVRVAEIGEGSASLARILASWQIDRRQAMRLIGFPEKD